MSDFITESLKIARRHNGQPLLLVSKGEPRRAKENSHD